MDIIYNNRLLIAFILGTGSYYLIDKYPNNVILYNIIVPVIISYLFVIYTEYRNKREMFRSTVLNLSKYFDTEYYRTCEPIPCDMVYDVKEFLSVYKCEELTNKENKLYKSVEEFSKTYSEDILTAKYPGKNKKSPDVDFLYAIKTGYIDNRVFKKDMSNIYIQIHSI